MHSSASLAKLENSKRSTAEDEKEKEMKKNIKIINVTDLKKKKNNIEITSIKEIGPNEGPNLAALLMNKTEKEKISLKKMRKGS